MNESPDSLAARVSSQMLAKEGTGPVWGLEIEETRENYARVRMTINQDMLNGHGTAHGGMIFALADSAFAYACNSHNSGTVGQQASIAYLAPAKLGETLIAEARQGPRSGRSAVTHVRVTSETDGRLIAEFTGLGRDIGGQIVDPLEDTHD
nr:hydroxyphenylacetyl-CoA thioesterase PaaI [uncultured Sphingomonas sp.]